VWLIIVDRFTVTYPPATLSYTQSIQSVQSLANNPSLAPSYAGLLYFPSTLHNCSDPALPGNGVPSNGITIDRLPIGFNLIALVPISACTSGYLMQAKRDQAEAVILYNYSSMSASSSPSLTNSFSMFSNPIYGIAADDATPILQNMVSYSGNMSSVPMGRNLTAIYDPTDYVRLTLTIDTGQGSSLPGLWLFLLVILAALGLIIASTSISMHVSQYRARRDLRRRIAAGEIDLESLGIKRLTAPREMIDSMPITIYGANNSTSKGQSTMVPKSVEKGATPTNTVTSDAPRQHENGNTLPKSDTSVELGSTVAEASAEAFDQAPCCAICLDDYIANTTPVRHLPCNHIFHPHCIDPFLQTRSSLCPLCKRSVLPKGFIPPSLTLTNATVARERRIRLMRERAGHRTASQEDGSQLENGTSGVEMTSPEITNVPAGDHFTAPTQEEEDEELRRRPLPRRVLETVFPYFTRPVGGAIRSMRRRSQHVTT
jgi:hypothetical protein